MVIRHSIQLLEQLSEVEDQIRRMEEVLRELNIDCDQEKLLKALLAKRLRQPSGKQS